MIRAKKIWGFGRNIFKPFDLDGSPNSPNNFHKSREQIQKPVGNRTRFDDGDCLRVSGIFAQHHTPSRERLRGTGAPAHLLPRARTLAYHIDQFANRVNLSKPRLLDITAEFLLHGNKQFDATHGIKP